jgi:hypothetical protein
MGEKSGTQLLFMDSDQLMCIADLETGQIEEVAHQFCGINSYKKVVPVEIECSAFFMSRLGVRRTSIYVARSLFNLSL